MSCVENPSGSCATVEANHGAVARVAQLARAAVAAVLVHHRLALVRAWVEGEPAEQRVECGGVHALSVDLVNEDSCSLCGVLGRLLWVVARLLGSVMVTRTS